MMLNFILWPAVIIATVAMFYENYTAIKIKNRVLIGVTIPYEHLNDRAVLDILEQYKKINMIYSLLGIVAFIPTHLISYFSLKMVYFFLWIAFLQILSYKLFFKYNNRLRKIKMDSNWCIQSTMQMMIDTEVTRLKNKMPVSPLWFIPSIIISFIPIIMVLQSNNITLGLIISSGIGLLGNIILIICYKIYCKKPTDIYTEDTKVNIAYNLVFKRMWTMGTVIAATVQSTGMIFVFLPMTLDSNSITLLILSLVIPPVIILSGIYYINNRVIEEQNRLLEACNKYIYIDNDQYWYRDVYNNPNDSRYIVEPRIGYKMTYNLGTKKGKRIYYGSLIFAALVVLGVSIMMLKLDFGRFSVIISKDVVNIEAPLYSTSINVKNIKEIKIIDNLDVNLRTNGAATDKYAIGHFELGEYGNSRIYIYDKNGPYIMLKLTNEEYIFISGTTNEETEKYYNELIKIY